MPPDYEGKQEPPKETKPRGQRKERSIMDNMLIMQVLVSRYHRNDGRLRCAMIDLMQAHDLAAWEFLFYSMEIVNFPVLFIQ